MRIIKAWLGAAFYATKQTYAYIKERLEYAKLEKELLDAIPTMSLKEIRQFKKAAKRAGKAMEKMARSKL